MPSIVVDAGPFIALFNRGDRKHALAMAYFENSTADLVTNIAIITETAHMLDFSRGAVGEFLMWASQSVEIDLGTAGDLQRIAAIVEKYADLPADFADASLVALCERLSLETVATFDHHFDVYRHDNGKPLLNVFAGP